MALDKPTIATDVQPKVGLRLLDVTYLPAAGITGDLRNTAAKPAASPAASLIELTALTSQLIGEIQGLRADLWSRTVAGRCQRSWWWTATQSQAAWQVSWPWLQAQAQVVYHALLSALRRLRR